jgi:signal transduction histidine kinase
MLQSSISVFEPSLHEAASSRGERMQDVPDGAPPMRATRAARAEEIAVICHELRNSLAVLRGTARLLRSSADPVELNTTRSLIERQVDQMSRHIDDLLQPRRRNGHSHGLQHSDIDLRVIVRNAVEDIGPEMARRGHRLAVALPGEPAWAHADGARLEQAFSNLLINAAKYTPDGGDITLTMERDHERVCVRVRDSGIGIERAMLSRIFGMYVQVSRALPSASSGSGIGLAAVQEVVEQHGGTVHATSPGLGLGSEFTVVLPGL